MPFYTVDRARIRFKIAPGDRPSVDVSEGWITSRCQKGPHGRRPISAKRRATAAFPEFSSAVSCEARQENQQQSTFPARNSGETEPSFCLCKRQRRKGKIVALASVNSDRFHDERSRFFEGSPGIDTFTGSRAELT